MPVGVVVALSLLLSGTAGAQDIWQETTNETEGQDDSEARQDDTGTGNDEGLGDTSAAKVGNQGEDLPSWPTEFTEGAPSAEAEAESTWTEPSSSDPQDAAAVLPADALSGPRLTRQVGAGLLAGSALAALGVMLILDDAAIAGPILMGGSASGLGLLTFSTIWQSRLVEEETSQAPAGRLPEGLELGLRMRF